MQLVPLDWIIVLVSIAVSFLPAILLARRAGTSTAEFFTSGRAAPWWLIGVSMVATTFSTDTPNLVTNFVREKGVANNWQWWAFLLTGMATVFFYARLWRRSGMLTDLEFYEIRYAGKAATFVRGFRSVYLGLFFNCVIIASVNLAAAKIANVMLGWPMLKTLSICAVLNIAFAATSGLWGVLVTDFIQFGIAMTGAVSAAVYALKQRGAEVRVVNRTVSRAQELAKRFGATAHGWEEVPRLLKETDVLVNCTSLGLAGKEPLEIDLGPLKKNAVVYDVVYVPLETGLLAQAKKRGHRTVDGLGMLLQQAGFGFRKWFGGDPKVTPELRSMIEADIVAKTPK